MQPKLTRETDININTIYSIQWDILILETIRNSNDKFANVQKAIDKKNKELQSYLINYCTEERDEILKPNPFGRLATETGILIAHVCGNTTYKNWQSLYKQANWTLGRSRIKNN